jgi:hypothetical protein
MPFSDLDHIRHFNVKFEPDLVHISISIKSHILTVLPAKQHSHFGQITLFLSSSSLQHGVLLMHVKHELIHVLQRK